MPFLCWLGCVAVTLVPGPAYAQDCIGDPGGSAVRLAIQARGVRTARGEIAFTVYPNDGRSFLARRGKLMRVRVPARSPVTETCFWLPPGQYAFAQHHDENGDRDYNRKIWDPKEGFGFSNNQSARGGLPSFEAVRTTVPAGGTSVCIVMQYGRWNSPGRKLPCMAADVRYAARLRP